MASKHAAGHMGERLGWGVEVRPIRPIAQKAGRIWREHGALEYRECVGDDLNVNPSGGR